MGGHDDDYDGGHPLPELKPLAITANVLESQTLRQRGASRHVGRSRN